MPDERTFTEAEHIAIVTDAVQREVAAAVADKDAKVSELEARVDVLEAERAAEVQAKEQVQAEFDSFKAGLAAKEEADARKTERVDRVKAAFASAPEDYFTEERIQRWAEMADEQFDALVADLTEVAAAAGPVPDPTKDPTKDRQTAAFKGGKSVSDPKGNGQSVLGKYLAARSGAPSN